MGHFSRHIVRTILRDKPSQMAIGLFVATFVHAMLALREVWFDDGGWVPGLAIIIACLPRGGQGGDARVVRAPPRSLSARVGVDRARRHGYLKDARPDPSRGQDQAHSDDFIPAPAWGVVIAVAREERCPPLVTPTVASSWFPPSVRSFPLVLRCFASRGTRRASLRDRDRHQRASRLPHRFARQQQLPRCPGVRSRVCEGAPAFRLRRIPCLLKAHGHNFIRLRR
jgi:hypothetical protein